MFPLANVLLIQKTFNVSSQIFEKAYKTLTGRNLVTEYLS